MYVPAEDIREESNIREKFKIISNEVLTTSQMYNIVKTPNVNEVELPNLNIVTSSGVVESSNLCNVEKNKENYSKKKTFRGYKIVQRKVDPKNFIKRIMLVKVDKSEIDKLDASFFHRKEEEIWHEIDNNEGWAHAKRFWAAVKFFHSTETGYKQEDICHFFGITRDIIKNFVKRKSLNDMKEFDYLSPVEIKKNRNRYIDFFKKNASNFEDLVKYKKLVVK